MKITNNNLNFKGYKNFLGLDCFNEDGHRSSYFSLQLDDNGQKDLSEFREILKYIGASKRELNSDVITFICTERPDHSKGMILNNLALSNANEMNQLEAEMPKDEYIIAERFNLKLYTFLARITRKMMKNDLIPQDAGMRQVMATTMMHFVTLFENNVRAFNLIQASCINPPKSSKLGSYINSTIHKEMVKYFK